MKRYQQIKIPSNKKEWVIFIIVLLLGLTFSSIDSIKEFLLGSYSQEELATESINNELIVQFSGENFDIFPNMVAVPVEYISATDGDTVNLRLNNHRFRARYLMVNTPEIGDSPQPYALEARERNHQLLSQAKKVTIAFDKGNHSDRYHRALIYIYADGVDVGEVLLEEGLASLDYIYPPNNSLEEVYREREAIAQDNKRGIWQ